MMHRNIGMILTLALCGLLLAAPASAQIGFGIKAGLNIANLEDLETIDSTEELEKEANTGFVGGAYVKFPMGPIRLQVEGLYSVKGAKGSAYNGLSSAQWETKLTYLEFPVLLKYEFPTPVLRPFVYGGGQVSFLMAAESRNERINSDWNDITDDLVSTDYGWILGGGIELLGLTLEARYNHGLANQVDVKSGNLLVDQAKNRNWAVMVGFDFF